MKNDLYTKAVLRLIAANLQSVFLSAAMAMCQLCLLLLSFTVSGLAQEQMDLGRYCQQHFGSGLFTNGMQTADGWVCGNPFLPGGAHPISIDAVCKEQLGSTKEAVRTTPPPGGPYDWVCQQAGRPPGGPPLAGSTQRAIADWQKHSDWCRNDGGTSGRAYASTCQVSDQYSSVVACQIDAAINNQDGGAALRAVRAAGPGNINAFMENRRGGVCISSFSPRPAINNGGAVGGGAASGGAAVGAISQVRIDVFSMPGDGCDSTWGRYRLINSSSQTIIATVHLTIDHGTGPQGNTEADQQVSVGPGVAQILGCAGNIGAQAIWRLVSAHY
jgi:hypothetical protein